MTPAVIPWGAELASTAAQFGDIEAVHDGVQGATLRALASRAAGLATMLRQRVAPGTPVATCLPNGIDAVWVSMGLRLAGTAEAALSPSYTEAERAYCVGLSSARLVIATSEQAARFPPSCEIVRVENLAAEADPAALPPVPGDAWGRIGFTSGTTGRPKAIVTTHAASWIGNILQRAHLDPMPRPGSRVMLMTPFIHGAGLITHAFHDRGAGIVLLNGVDLPVVRRVLEERGVDHVFAPPTVLAKLVAAFEGQRFEHIRTIFCGTAPLLPTLYAKARAIFGPVIRVTYGKSEIVNPITVLPPRATDAYYAEPDPGEGVCVGWPGSGVEIELRDGEVFLRGRHMYAGHIDAEGFHPLPEDGFHATGDLGRIDTRGRLHLVGRMADVIKSGGYKIHPDEIERVLAGTSGAGAVSIVALRSEYWGEVIVAVAEAADSAWPERARTALSVLARHKHPRAFLTVPELARNPQGKIMRRLVRDRLLDAYRLIDGPHPRLEPR